MKILVFLLSIVSFSSFANEKIYTQDEFDKQLQEQLEKTLKKIGNGDLLELSNALLQKEKKILEKENELKKAKDELEAFKKELEAQVQDFEKRQSDFLACIDKTESDNSKRVGHMVDIVSGMKAQAAADVLSVQEPALTVRILEFLEPQKVSKIFNVMDKEISARLQKQFMTMKK